MPPSALRHPTFSLSRKLSVVGDSLPRGLNWPIKALALQTGPTAKAQGVRHVRNPLCGKGVTHAALEVHW